MPRWLAAVLATALLCAACGGDDGGPTGDGSGAGLRWEGTFYWRSSATVRPTALGDVLGEEVPFEDRTADVRRVVGLDPGDVLAVASSDAPGDWWLAAADAGTAADPWSSRDTAAVVGPPAG